MHGAFTGTSVAGYIVTLLVLATVEPPHDILSAETTYGVLLAVLTAMALLGWAACGMRAGVLFSCLTAAIAAIVSARAGAPGISASLSVFVFLNILAGFVAYSHHKSASEEMRMMRIETEEIESDRNVLMEEYDRHESGAEALRRKIERYSYVNMLTEMLGSSLDLDKVAGYTTSRTLDVIGKGESCLLFVSGKDELNLLASSVPPGSEKIKSKKGDLYDRWVIKHKQGLLVSDVEKDFRFTDSTGVEPGRGRAIIAVPLVSSKTVTGVLRVESVKSDAFTADDLRLLVAIGDISGEAIENCMLYRETQELAIRDGLTGLFLPGYFHQRFQEEIMRTLRTNSFLSILMCDIDNFKQTNDTYGHKAGDIVLKEIAKAIAACMEPGDLVSRYGGEEFAVILPRRNREKAVEMAERLRAAVENCECRHDKGTLAATISIGVASFWQDGMTKEDLIKAADDRLYEAKAAGKNRVC